MEVFRKRGLYVVTNPASNAKLASGTAPIREYLQKGIPVAIGTDGPASNNCLDMFREMFLVTALAKLRENDASAVDAWEVLKMVVHSLIYLIQIQIMPCDLIDLPGFLMFPVIHGNVLFYLARLVFTQNIFAIMFIQPLHEPFPGLDTIQISLYHNEDDKKKQRPGQN